MKVYFPTPPPAASRIPRKTSARLGVSLCRLFVIPFGAPRANGAAHPGCVKWKDRRGFGPWAAGTSETLPTLRTGSCNPPRSDGQRVCHILQRSHRHASWADCRRSWSRLSPQPHHYQIDDAFASRRRPTPEVPFSTKYCQLKQVHWRMEIKHKIHDSRAARVIEFRVLSLGRPRHSAH